MKNIALELSFDGTAYHGWQIQDNAVSVQALLRDAIYKTTGEDVSIIGCSRTDAGVHAKSFVCNFHSETGIPLDRLHLPINNQLPRDIVARRAWEAAEDFHARYSAKGKTYQYQIWNGAMPDPFLLWYAYHMPCQLDFEAMRAAAPGFLGEHDFTTFMAAGGNQKTTVRNISALSLTKGGGLITIEITANAYLYNMVRIIAGTLVYVGLGRIAPETIPQIVQSRDRLAAGPTLPPQGLFLKEVRY